MYISFDKLGVIFLWNRTIRSRPSTFLKVNESNTKCLIPVKIKDFLQKYNYRKMTKELSMLPCWIADTKTQLITPTYCKWKLLFIREIHGWIHHKSKEHQILQKYIQYPFRKIGVRQKNKCIVLVECLCFHDWKLEISKIRVQ